MKLSILPRRRADPPRATQPKLSPLSPPATSCVQGKLQVHNTIRTTPFISYCIQRHANGTDIIGFQRLSLPLVSIELFIHLYLKILREANCELVGIRSDFFSDVGQVLRGQLFHLTHLTDPTSFNGTTIRSINVTIQCH